MDNQTQNHRIQRLKCRETIGILRGVEELFEADKAEEFAAFRKKVNALEDWIFSAGPFWLNRPAQTVPWEPKALKRHQLLQKMQQLKGTNMGVFD